MFPEFKRSILRGLFLQSWQLRQPNLFFFSLWRMQDMKLHFCCKCPNETWTSLASEANILPFPENTCNYLSNDTTHDLISYVSVSCIRRKVYKMHVFRFRTPPSSHTKVDEFYKKNIAFRDKPITWKERHRQHWNKCLKMYLSVASEVLFQWIWSPYYGPIPT